MLAPSKPSSRNRRSAASRIATPLARSLGRPGAGRGAGGVSVDMGIDKYWTGEFDKYSSRRLAPGRGPPHRSSAMAGTRNHRWIAGLVLVLPLVSMLAACGAGDPVAEPARPVLVAQPQPAAGVARGFPGEIRAREESPLAFRVGGELLRRE